VSDDWRVNATLTVDQTAEILGLSRNGTYTAISTGEIPSVRVGHRLLVPVVQLRRLLGEIAETTDDAR
jgi:excisionase family DNA binding protein